MEPIHYNINRIRKITSSELQYQEDRGDILSIDLKMCRDRYLKYINSHLEEYPTRNGIPMEDDDNFKCVADRYFAASENAYFEFYDWPHIRFEISIKITPLRKFLNLIGWNWSQKYYKQFLSIQDQLWEAGWVVFDLN